MPASSPLRVAIVDDHELVVKGLATMLEPYRHRLRVVPVSSADPLKQRIDIALFDSLAQRGGDEVVRAILASRHIRRFAVYTWQFHSELVDAALESGADGYLSKSLRTQPLMEALERVHAGERVVCPALGEQSGEAVMDEELTQRESEILALITQGLSNNEIVERTHLSINSVKTYIRTAYRKVGVTTRSQAVLWGVRNGLEADHRAVAPGAGAQEVALAVPRSKPRPARSRAGSPAAARRG